MLCVYRDLSYITTSQYNVYVSVNYAITLSYTGLCRNGHQNRSPGNNAFWKFELNHTTFDMQSSTWIRNINDYVYGKR